MGNFTNMSVCGSMVWREDLSWNQQTELGRKCCDQLLLWWKSMVETQRSASVTCEH